MLQVQVAADRSRSQHPPQQHARLGPVALNAPDTDGQRRGDLLLGQPAEETADHNLLQPGVEAREPFQRLVELQQRLGSGVHRDVGFREGDAVLLSATFRRRQRPGTIHQDMPHRQRRQRQKMDLVPPLGSGLIDQLQVSLVHQPRGGEAPAPPAGPELTMGNTAQFLVDQWDEPVELGPPAGTQFVQEIRSGGHQAGGFGRVFSLSEVRTRGTDAARSGSSLGKSNPSPGVVAVCPALRIALCFAPVGFTLLACASPVDPPPPGRLRVVAATSGGDLPESYQVILDGGIPRMILANTPTDFGALPDGRHVIALADVAGNCDLSGGSDRIVTVTRGETSEVHFAIVCYATGIEIQVSTAGVDPGLFTVQVGAGPPTHVGPNGVHRQTRLAPGEYAVVLGELPANCSQVAGPPPAIQVAPRQVTQVSFLLQCVAISGVLEVLPATAGQDLDQNGYLIRLGGTGVAAAMPNEPFRVHLPAGRIAIELKEVASNCGLLTPGTQEANIRAGGLTRDTARITFSVECSRTEKLAFVENDLIVVSYADGSNATMLPLGADPDWSPNGNSLAFQAKSCPGMAGPPLSNYSGGWPPPPPCIEMGIWIVTQPPRPLARLLTTDSRDRHPAWSPDGEMVAFERDGSLRLIRVDGTQILALPTPGVQSASAPSWSPDGTRLVFTCQVEYGNDDLCVINRNGSGFQRLTNDPGPDNEPDWGPDGRIAFTTGRYTLREDIALLDPGSGAVVRVAAGKSPAWSGDGTRLAFSIPGLGIAVVRPDGTGIQIVSNQGGYAPSWRP